MHFLEFRKKFSLLKEEEREFICKLSLKDAISFLKTIYWYNKILAFIKIPLFILK